MDTRIGKYVLIERLGEGGMGTVWRARQAPFGREVAIKFPNQQSKTSADAHRYLAECQAMAMLNHQHIARLYDADKLDDETPYLVMELVHGEPITQYCNDETRSMSIEERLRLFCLVCDAVQHAHERTIIHRDLKPANVLVCNEGGDPFPNVIDFGVAKSAHSFTSEAKVARTGEIVGTLEFMSPEQLSPSSQKLDVATDVYSLGVMLYGLVTGSRPYQLSTASRVQRDRIATRKTTAVKRSLLAFLQFVLVSALQL